MTVTLKDVAAKAGVSLATASRVLSRSDYLVLPDLRQKVEQAARELDYIPNAQAQGLLTGTTGMIGVLVGDVSDPYFSDMVNGVHNAASKRKRLVTICHTRRDPMLELEYFKLLQAHRAGAVIIAGSGLDHEEYIEGLMKRADSFRANGGKVVAVGSPLIDVDSVVINNSAGSAELGRYLVSAGHRSVLMLAGPQWVASTTERVDGLRSEVTRSGGELEVLYGAPTRDDAYERMRRRFPHPHLQLRGSGREVSAIVGSADQLAMGAMGFLRDQGIAVPKETSIAGFNDIPLTADLTPSLTTVRVPLREIGEAALVLALEPAHVSGESRVTHFTPTLVVRESTADAPE